MAYLNEAIIMMEEGASFTAIDRALLSFGMPMGPFTLLDEIGIRVGFKVAKVLSQAFPERSPLGKLFSVIGSDDSLLGRSAGKGFYSYKGKKAEPNQTVLKILRDNKIPAKPFAQEEIISRCIMRMLNESVFCLGESIVDTASHLDMALILGIGFPPFRGGLLRYADTLGIPSVLTAMKGLETHHGRRFMPAPLLITMAENKERFYHEN
jgi:3-hydroxyacyl-CoA dehydrogenase/enoyl-CoA hydratase/3-hydroxybutyryl-CoA epimerase